MNGLHLAMIVLFGTALDAAAAQPVAVSRSAPIAGQHTTIQAASVSRQSPTQGTSPSTGGPNQHSSLLIGPCDVLDDGSSENALGLAAPTGTDVLWMQRQGDVGQSTVVLSISTAWGTPAFPGSGPANGSTARYGIWQDTDNDGNPTTGLSLVAGPLCVIVAGTGTETFPNP